MAAVKCLCSSGSLVSPSYARCMCTLLFASFTPFLPSLLSSHPSPPPTSLLIAVDEKNERIKESIRKKITEYLERAEKLKEHLNKPKKKAVATGETGGTTGAK